MSDNKDNNDPETMLDLGAWLGRHQAFGLIANRCSAADAECLKKIRDSGQYKQLGLTWEQFCIKHAGVSRVHADRQIHYFEELGATYFRFAEVMPISAATYRLIAAGITEDGIESAGERIPLVRENRDKIAAAVAAARAKTRPAKAEGGGVGDIAKRLDALIAEADVIAAGCVNRVELKVLVDKSIRDFQRLAHALRDAQ